MKEHVYDEKINPLVAEILALCKKHKIAMIADFALDGDLHCTSSLLTDDFGPSAAQLQAWELLRPKRAFAMAETIETLPGGGKKITLRRIS